RSAALTVVGRVAGEDAVFQGDDAAVAEDAAPGYSGLVGGNGAVQQSCRARVVDPATFRSGAVSAHRGVLECERARVVDAVAVAVIGVELYRAAEVGDGPGGDEEADVVEALDRDALHRVAQRVVLHLNKDTHDPNRWFESPVDREGLDRHI